MNRRERRALERAGKVPKQEAKYTLTVNEIMQAKQVQTRATIDELIKEEILKKDKDFMLNMDTMYLWVLHKKYGWGYKRLKQFYLDTFQEHLRMREFYEMDDMYLEKVKLKEETGVDVEDWYSKLFHDDGTYKDISEVEL